MALRVRADGSIWCAAHTQPEPGDTYIDDGLHYALSVQGVIVALPMPEHTGNPRWWWAGNAPDEADRWAQKQGESDDTHSPHH